MPTVLIASDSPSLRAEVRSVVESEATTVREVDDGALVGALVGSLQPDLVVLDLQIGAMGAMAVASDLHLDASAGRLPRVPVLMLLDRRADVFLARRSNVEGWLIKPLDPIRIRRAVAALVAGETFYDTSYLPAGAAVARAAAPVTSRG